MLTSRLANIKKSLAENSVDAALISSIPDILYLTDFPYFSDMEREAFILITPKNNYIFTDARYSHAVKTHLKNFTLLEISIDASFIKLLQEVIKKEKITTLGIEENNITVAEHKKISSVCKSTKHFDLTSLRITKDSEEIEKIKKACAIGDQTFSYILKQIKLGQTEKEIAFLLETYIRQHGCEPSFPSIVAFGKNAAIPHHKTNDQKLKTNDLILLDFGVKYEEYCSDMTRTIFFGKTNDEQKKIYSIVREAQQAAIEQYNHEKMKKSKTIKAQNLDNAARSYIVTKGYPSIPHSLGHGIGLQVHEAPSLSPKSESILTEGMVFSIEPGIYLPDKMGVRIEDLFAIQHGRLVQLTKSQNQLLELKT